MSDTRSAARFCPNCGSEVEPWARFCRECGAEQPGDATSFAAAPQEPHERIAPWEAIVLPLGTIIVQAIAVFIVALAVGVENQNRVVAISIVVSELIMLGIVLAWVKGFHRMSMRDVGWRSGGVGRDLRAGIGVAVLGLIAQVPLLLLGQWIGRLLLGRSPEAPQQLPFEGSPDVFLIVLTGIGAVILAPIAEESLFRGIMFQGFRNRWGFGVAAALSAVLFGLVHISPLLWLPIGFLGFLLARVFDRHSSLVPAMIAHGLFNAVGFSVLVSSYY